MLRHHHRGTHRLLRFLHNSLKASHPLPHLLKHLVGSRAALSDAAPGAADLTLHFLRKSCGLPEAAAAAVAARVHLRSTKKAHAVLALLRGVGFDDADLARLVAVHPFVLSSDAGRTLAPKFQFYRGELGLSDANLRRLILATPNRMLQFSLERRLRPNYVLLKGLLGTDDNVSAAVKQSSQLIYDDLSAVLLPKVEALRQQGVPNAVLVKLLTKHPRALVHRSSRFDQSFVAMLELGISLSSGLFPYAFGIFARTTQFKWSSRVENFLSLGWSKEQVMQAFARHPYCMSVSDGKVRCAMRFFVEKLSWSPEYVSVNPVVLSLSFEKRILPRCAVLDVLVSRGILKSGIRASHLTISDKKFVEKYVTSYQESIPQVREAYGARMAKVK